MKYLKYFESKQVTTLYHIFDLENCDYILNTNSLSSYKFGNISTTREKMMNHYLGDKPISIFKLELDGEKLSNKYKIKPYAYPSTEIGTYGERTPIRLEEFEEVILTNEIKNINQYVNKFIIIKSKVERLKTSGWFDNEGGYFNSDRINLPDFLKKKLPKIKELFGDIYIQDGTKIIKDDDWLDSILNYPIKQINHGYCLYWRGYKKNPHYKYGIVDDVKPLDIKNKSMDKLVIGWDYDNLHLYKSNIFKNLPNARKKHNLYLFDFEYELEDVISETDETVYVKSGYLSHIEILKKNTENINY